MAPPRRPRPCRTSPTAGPCDRGGGSHGASVPLVPHRRAQPAPGSVTVLPHSSLVPPALARPSGLMPLAPPPRPGPARGRPCHPRWSPTACALASSSHQTPWPQTFGSNNGSTTRTSRLTIFGESWRDLLGNRWNGSGTHLRRREVRTHLRLSHHDGSVFLHSPSELYGPRPSGRRR